MDPIGEAKAQPLPRAVTWALALLTITSLLSLAYAIQYYLGGPVRLPVVSEFLDVEYSREANLVAAGAQDGTVRVWEIPPDMRTAIPKGFSIAREPLWKQHRLSGHHRPVIEVGFAPGGTRLYSIDSGGGIWEWDLSTYAGRLLGTVGGGPFKVASFSADRTSVATLANDGTVRVTNVASGSEQVFAPSDSHRLAIALSADGALVAIGEGSNVVVREAGTGLVVSTMKGDWRDPATRKEWQGHTRDVTALAFDPQAQVLASGGLDRALVFWDVRSGKWLGSSERHWAAVTRLVFDDQGKVVATGSRDNLARTFLSPGGKRVGIYQGQMGAIYGIAFGPPLTAAEGEASSGATRLTLLTAGSDGTLRHWEPVNNYAVHLEWSHYGFQPTWGKTLALWMLVSGVLGLVCAYGMRRAQIWSHLLALALFLVGPLAVLGLPLLEVLLYPLLSSVKLRVAWVPAALAAVYGLILVVLTRESVQVSYEAPGSMELGKQLTIRQRTLKARIAVYGLAVWETLLIVLFSVLRRLNLNVAFMSQSLPFIMQGAWLTLWISAASIALAVVLALLGALGRISKNPIANGVSGFYVSLIRGTPLLVQIYIWYFGLPQLGIIIRDVKLLGITIGGAELAGVLALGVNYGAYMTEIFRAGIQAIGKGQYEAAAALGMSRAQTLRRIVLPQAFRVVIPPIGNEFIAMMKDSSLVSAMAVWELTYRAEKIGKASFRRMEAFIIAAGFYWILTVAFQFLQGKLENYMARGERR